MTISLAVIRHESPRLAARLEELFRSALELPEDALLADELEVPPAILRSVATAGIVLAQVRLEDRLAELPPPGQAAEVAGFLRSLAGLPVERRLEKLAEVLRQLDPLATAWILLALGDGPEEEPVDWDAARLRHRLGVQLGRALDRLPAEAGLSGALPVVGLVGGVAPRLSLADEVWLTALARATAAADALRPDERAYELAVFPRPVARRFVPPAAGIDPATLVGVPVRYRWLRCPGPLLLEPCHDSQVKVLGPGGWRVAARISNAVLVHAEGEGVMIRKAAQGLVAGIGRGAPLLDAPVPALWIEAEGVHGWTPLPPLSFDPGVEAAAYPPGWRRPEEGVRVSRLTVEPRAGLIRPSGPAPRGVVVCGIPLPETGKPGQLVGWDPRLGKGPGPDPGDPGGGPGGLGIGLVAMPVQRRLTVDGCQCLREGSTGEYRAEGAPPGGSYQWSVDDDTIAEIVGPDDVPEITLRGKAIGEVVLTVRYTEGGVTLQEQMGVAVIYQQFTDRPESENERHALPLVQPAPTVEIEAASVRHEVTGVSGPDRRITLEIRFRGTLSDALEEIREVEVLSGSGFRRRLPRGLGPNGGFTDTAFDAREVEVKGPGRCYVRVKAGNTVGHRGTDTLEVVVAIPETWRERINEREEDLLAAIERGDPADVVADYRRRVDTVWQYALEQAEIEVAVLTRVGRPDPKPGRNDKWSVLVKDDDEAGTVQIATSAEVHDVTLKKRRPKRLKPNRRPKEYLLLPDDYSGGVYDWERKGAVKSLREDLATLVYLDDCCQHSVPVVSVKVDPQPGRQRVRPGEPIRLSAKGTPREVLGVAGLYRWSVLKHPAGAEGFRFEPDGPTAQDTVGFVTETGGLYSFRVDYSVAGVGSPWTYAVADAQVLLDVSARPRIERLGDYDRDDLRPHRERALLRERTPGPQPGAEIMVEGQGADLGQDLDLEVLCPTELRLQSTLRARLHLGDGSTRDLRFSFDAREPFRATRGVRSVQPIRKIHVIGIRYGDLVKRRGDDVWIDVRARPVEPPVADLGDPQVFEDPAAPPSGAGASVLVVDAGDHIDVSAPGSEEQARPLVNLILRARDLGPAGGTHALAAVSSLPIQATLVNGNVHARLALFAVTGSFGVLGAALSYDSLAATRSAAIRRYAALNGRNREQVEAEFGVRVLPDGWSCTLLPTLVPFVDPDGGLENPILRRCLELALDDGNHLVFEETAQAGVYHVRHAAEALDDDADGALSLVLTRTGETFRLGTDDSRYRLFDDRGRLVEDRRGPGETITLDWQDDAITITDPGQQAIRLALEDRRIVRITSPADHTWTLTPREDRLEGLTDPGGNAWRFQAGTDGLLTGVEGPADLPVTLGYYLGRDVEGVPPAVAEKFWGRLARMVQGERSLQVRYGDRAERQEIVVVDPEGHRRRVVYETERQAAVEVDYANNRAPEEYRELRRITYRETSKAPRTLRNHLGGTMHYGYAPQPQWARAHALTSLRAATGGEWFYSRDGRGRVETVTAPGRGTTAYRYQGDTDLVERIELPAVPTLAPGGGPATFAPVETFAYDERERETRTVSMEGVETAFGYGDPPGQSRDPHRRGRVTRVTTAGQTWSYSWDVMGRLERVESPGGHVRRFEYDHAGRIEKVHDADTWVKASYDPLGRLERIEDSLGRASGLTYSAYGEPHVRTDSEGHTVEFASRDRNGNVTRLVLEDGAEHTYQEFDALGRWRRHVPPDVSRNGPQGFVSFPAPAVEADHVDRPEAFPEAGEATLRTVYQVGSVKVTLHRNAAGLPAGEVVEEEGRTRATVTRYDALGEVASVHEFEDGRLLATTLRLERDALGRVTRSEQGGVVTRYGRARDGRGIYQVEAFPAYARQEGGAPSSGMRFDDLGRLVALFDGRGDDVVQYRYDDVARRLEIRAADPSAGDQLRLEPIVVRRFDRRGLVVGEETVAQGPVAARETTWARDGFGRVLTVSARDGEVRTFEYDDLDRVRRVTLTVPAVAAPPLSVGPDPAPPATGPRSAVMEVDYDDAGRVRRRAFADGTSEEVAYDRLGRPASITRRGLGGGVQVEQLFYDRSGELRARWYAPDVYWFVQKDAAGRTLTEVQQMGTRRAERVLVTDGLGAVVGYREAGRDLSFAYGYDDAGRLTEYRIARAGGEVAGLTWDYGPAPGPERLRIRTSQGSREVLWTYDQDQRVVGASCSELTEGRPFRFRFGRAGLLSRLERPWSGDALSTLRYHAHGGLHELKHVVGEGWEEDWTTTISAADYDRSGNPRRVQNQHSLGYWDIVTGETHFDDNFTTEETYEYDGADRLTRVVARGDDSRVERRVFFDVNGRPVLEITRQTPDDDDPDEVRRQTVRNTFSGQALRRTEVVWSEPDETARRRHTTVYGYDLFGRLTVATETLDHSEEGGGRWARATEYTYGVTDLPLGQRTIEWRGDERVLVETVENGYDVSGRLASSASRLYARPRFGVEGFWATALLAAAEASDFVSAVLSPGQPLEEKELFFVHAGGDLIAVLDKDGRPVEEYLVGPGINNRLAVRYKPPDEADRLVASYHFDRTGSSLLLTRTDGEIVEEFSQAATIAGGSYRSDRYVHSGMWLDPATGLFQAGSRVLRPASGQFLSSDPLGLSGGGATYAFAANDRPRLADPTGQHPVLVLVAFVAGNVLLDLVVDFAIARWTRSRFDPDRSLVENVVLNVLTAGTGLGKLAKLRHTSRFVRVLAKTAIRHRRPLAFALEVAGGAAFEAATTGRSFGATLAGASLGAAGLAGGLKGLRALAYGSQHLHRMAFNSPVRRFRDKVDELSGLAELELPGAMGVKAYLYLRRQGGFKMAGEFGASSAVEVVRHHFGDAIAELHQQVEYVTARGILTLVARLGPDAFRSIVRRPANFGTRVHAAIKVEFQETLLAAERTLDDVKLEALHLFMKKESTYLGDVRRLTDLRPDVAFLEAVNGRAVRFFWDPTTPGQVGKVFDKYGKDPLAVFLSDVTYDRDALRALFL